MRLWKVFLKNTREMLRDPLVLVLTLVFAPAFVMVYALFFPSGSTTYTILVYNLDAGAVQPDGTIFRAGDQVAEAIQAVTYADGQPMLLVRTIDDEGEAETMLRDRKALVRITLPGDLSNTVLAMQAGEPSPGSMITFGGDLTNPYYPVAAILATSAVDAYIQSAAGRPAPVQYIEQPLGGSGARTEFETYVPGLFVFATIMLIFLAAMTVAREVEAGTLHRLQISRMTALDLLGGITITLLVIGLIAELLTFATALGMGFRSQGPLWVALLVGVLTSLAVIGAGLVVAGFSRSVAQAFVIANFPLALFMFFSGVMFPIQKIVLFSVGGHDVGLFDFLPTAHAVAALNKIFTLGAGFDQVAFELAALAALSVLYFAAGVRLFHHRHMRAG